MNGTQPSPWHSRAILRSLALFMASIACYLTFVAYPGWVKLQTTRAAAGELQAKHEQFELQLAASQEAHNQAQTAIEQAQFDSQLTPVSLSHKSAEDHHAVAAEATLPARLQAVQAVFDQLGLRVISVALVDGSNSDALRKAAGSGSSLGASIMPARHRQKFEILGDFEQMQSALHELAKNFESVCVDELQMQANRGVSSRWSVGLSMTEELP